jgi:N-acetylated-alpha-linked acidic dipeptidase
MASERTPLIQTAPVAPPYKRYRHNVTRRFCTIACGSSLIAILLLVVLPVALLPHAHRHHPHPTGVPSRPKANAVSYKELQDILLTTPTGEKADEWSRYYTGGPHLAGKNYSQALWTKEKWEEFGVASSIVAYETYLNYPLGHRLALYEKISKNSDSQATESWKVKYEASLEEDILEEDSTTSLPDRVPTFHGYSATGNVTATYVYVNYGTYQDFEDLVRANVSLKGKIAIARYGGIFRGLKVKRAQDLGMIGTVIYTDPGDDGELSGSNGNNTYPNGPARNPSSVQRGSTQFLSVAPGDP